VTININAMTGQLTVSPTEPVGTFLAIKVTALGNSAIFDTRTIQVIADPNGIASIAITSGPSAVKKGATGAYAATLTRNNGTTAPATGAAWSFADGTNTTAAGSTINASTGVLSVAAGETAGRAWAQSSAPPSQ